MYKSFGMRNVATEGSVKKVSLCAVPQATLRRDAGARFRLVGTYSGGHKQLPIVELKRAA